MSNFDPNYAVQRGVGTDRTAAEIDQGLRSYMLAVYNYMAIGVALTGVAAWIAFQLAGGDAITVTGGRIGGLTDFGRLLFSMPGMIVMLVATFGLVLFISFRIDKLAPATALTLFLFFISAASFGALSLYGYTTKRDLSAFGAFLIMGLVGLFIAMIVNMFWQNTMMGFIISIVGVLIFAGLTAWDTQKIKEMYDVNDDGTITARKAIMGALTLYLDFINLFLFLLRLLGDRR
jgi:uncharacterized protein